MAEPITVTFPIVRRNGAPRIGRAPIVGRNPKKDRASIPVPPTSVIPKLVHPVTGDRIYDEDESEFLMAVDRFKRDRGKKFPSLTDLLAILRSLGYVKPPVAIGVLGPPNGSTVGPVAPLVKVAAL